MKSFSTSSSTNHSLAHLLQGTALAVSDGSYFPTVKMRSCARIIFIPAGQRYIRDGGLIPGSSCNQSLYRSELGGLLNIASTVSNIILPLFFTPNITVARDGLATLNNMKFNKEKMKLHKKEVGLISAISSW